MKTIPGKPKVREFVANRCSLKPKLGELSGRRKMTPDRNKEAGELVTS